ncbi:hypothetical protein KIN20_006826 [Parelaphostrongylus tenuis]|uniref:Uncharacterized protein n=1 Tax=Parelaphostrongylus tenuis TaxID=148309 RepID=A0AAD5MUK6_PARTN|nr:hypothetical protein KIN20_006826 [Parelaphostrongylus tenuis]
MLNGAVLIHDSEDERAVSSQLFSYVFFEATEKDQQSPLDMPLVRPQSGFLPIANRLQKEFHQQPIHFITDTAIAIEVSRWSDWSEWGKCFCNKQLRTRRCIFSSSLSQGCEGNSYESRNCTGGWCPTSSPPQKREFIESNRSQGKITIVNIHTVASNAKQLSDAAKRIEIT